MSLRIERRALVGAAIAAAGLIVSIGFSGYDIAEAQNQPAPFKIAPAEPFNENAKAQVLRFTVLPGATQELHTAPVDQIVIQLTPGPFRFLIDGKEYNPGRPGQVWWIEANKTMHAAFNTGKEPVDLMVVNLKPR